MQGNQKNVEIVYVEKSNIKVPRWISFIVISAVVIYSVVFLFKTL